MTGNSKNYAKVKSFGSINTLSRSWSNREQKLSHTRVRQDGKRQIAKHQ